MWAFECEWEEVRVWVGGWVWCVVALRQPLEAHNELRKPLEAHNAKHTKHKK